MSPFANGTAESSSFSIDPAALPFGVKESQMNSIGLDGERTGMRVIVATIDRLLADPKTQLTAERLRPSWALLVQALALGPEPELRECPHCGKMGMLEATRCGFCWTALA
jgi:hypothetical protein